MMYEVIFLHNKSLKVAFGLVAASESAVLDFEVSFYRLLVSLNLVNDRYCRLGIHHAMCPVQLYSVNTLSILYSRLALCNYP